MDKIYFVTGGTGLLGAHLILKLIGEEKKVRALYRNKKSLLKAKRIFNYYTPHPDSIFNQVDWVMGDVEAIECLDELIKGCCSIYHCAALVSFHPKDAKRMYAINVHGTKNMVNVALSSPDLEDFVFISSTAAVGADPRGELTNEKFTWDKTNASYYALTKKQAELEVWRGSEEGLKVIIVNPCVIIGPGIWEEGSANLFLKIYNGLKYYTPGANAFVDVNDVVNAVLLLQKNKIYQERFLVIGENLSFKHLFSLIADALQVKAPHKLAQLWQAQILRYWSSITTFLFGTYPLITKDTIHSAYQNSKYDNTKILTQTPLKIKPIAQSIHESAQYFLNDQKSIG